MEEKKYLSQAALGKFLQNLTYQALSQENDKVFMSFSETGLLVNDLLEQLSAISKEIRKQLKTDFSLNLSPEIKIQRQKKEIEVESEPIQFSTPLKKRRNRRNLWWTKRTYFTNGFNS